jgi:hypothetical protein
MWEASGSSVAPSVRLWVARNQEGMNAKEHCSGITYRTLGSSSVPRRVVLSALVVERRLRGS